MEPAFTWVWTSNILQPPGKPLSGPVGSMARPAKGMTFSNAIRPRPDGRLGSPVDFYLILSGFSLSCHSYIGPGKGLRASKWPMRFYSKKKCPPFVTGSIEVASYK